MNIERLKITKQIIEQLEEFLESLESNGWTDLPKDITFKQVLRLDLCKYAMYLIASDKSINTDEVEMYRFLTGFGGDDMDSIKDFIESSNVMSYEFQSTPPISLVSLVKATNSLIRVNLDASETIKKIYELYVFSFMLSGKEMLKADNKVSYDEQNDYETYIETIKGYIKRHSYVSPDYSEVDRMAKLSDYLD